MSRVMPKSDIVDIPPDLILSGVVTQPMPNIPTHSAPLINGDHNTFSSSITPSALPAVAADPSDNHSAVIEEGDEEEEEGGAAAAADITLISNASTIITTDLIPDHSKTTKTKPIKMKKRRATTSQLHSSNNTIPNRIRSQSDGLLSNVSNSYLSILEPSPIFPPDYQTLPPGGCPNYPIYNNPMEGRESLPNYSPAVYKIARLNRKLEWISPYELAYQRSWKKIIVELNSTQLNIYNGEHKLSETEISSNSFNPNEFSNYNSNITNSKDLNLRSYLTKKNLLGPSNLIRSYSLQFGKIGLAIDYKKKKNVLRLRIETEQFLLQFNTVEDMIEWYSCLSLGIDNSLDIGKRDMPKYRTVPRRRRRLTSNNNQSEVDLLLSRNGRRRSSFHTRSNSLGNGANIGSMSGMNMNSSFDHHSIGDFSNFIKRKLSFSDLSSQNSNTNAVDNSSVHSIGTGSNNITISRNNSNNNFLQIPKNNSSNNMFSKLKLKLSNNTATSSTKQILAKDEQTRRKPTFNIFNGNNRQNNINSLINTVNNSTDSLARLPQSPSPNPIEKNSLELELNRLRLSNIVVTSPPSSISSPVINLPQDGAFPEQPRFSYSNFEEDGYYEEEEEEEEDEEEDDDDDEDDIESLHDGYDSHFDEDDLIDEDIQEEEEEEAIIIPPTPTITKKIITSHSNSSARSSREFEVCSTNDSHETCITSIEEDNEPILTPPILPRKKINYSQLLAPLPLPIEVERSFNMDKESQDFELHNGLFDMHDGDIGLPTKRRIVRDSIRCMPTLLADERWSGKFVVRDCLSSSEAQHHQPMSIDSFPSNQSLSSMNSASLIGQGVGIHRNDVATSNTFNYGTGSYREFRPLQEFIVSPSGLIPRVKEHYD